MNEPIFFWDREQDLDERGREMVNRAITLYKQIGVERRDALDAALTAYYGNSRHCLSSANFRSEQVVAFLATTFGLSDLHDAPPGQNLIQMVVNTMVGHTIHDKVRPFFLTEKGDADAREQAQGMMRATEGILTSEGMYGDLAVALAKLGYLSDGGFLDVIPDYARNKVTLRLVLPHEWLVEKGERVGYRYEIVDKWMALEDFGYRTNEKGEREKTELYELIKNAPKVPSDFQDDEPNEDGSHCDRVLIIHGYHRPSGYVDLDDEASFGLNDDGEVDDSVDPGHDGIRLVCLSDGTVLHQEPYPYDDTPICEFFPSKDPVSYGSCGIPERLAGVQLAINKHNRRIEGIIHLHAVPRIVAQRQSKINPNKISNGLADILWSNTPVGQAIQYLQPPPVPGDLINRNERLEAWGKALSGTNDMALAGEKPAGVDHAPGMEHLSEELTLRHTEESDAWKRLFIKASKRIVECCRMLALRDPNFEVVFEDDKFLERIKWRDVELERKRFSLKTWPTNLLAKTPAAKMRRLTELKALGAVTDQQIQAALVDEYPDLAGLVGDAASSEKNLRRKIDKIAKHGYAEEYAPHPYINPAMAKALALEAINRFEEEGNDEAMDNVIEFYEAVDDLELARAAKQNAAMQGVAPPAPAMGAPPAPPGAPPVPGPPVPPAPIPGPGMPQ